MTGKKAVTLLRFYIALLHALIVALLWTLGRTANMSVIRLPPLKGLTWSPAQHLIEYEMNSDHATDGNHHSQFSGPPDDKQDEAWDALLRPVYFNASTEEVRRAKETITEDTAELSEGGYLVNLAVYHELHCLRQLRFWLYRDRYYPNLTDAEDAYQRHHLDHCLETLRLRVQCDANTALYTFRWDEPTDIRPILKSDSRPLEEWAYSRMVPRTPIFNKRRLVA